MRRELGFTQGFLSGSMVSFGAVGIILTSWLVYSELFRAATCPDFLGVPACFLVLAGYAAATFGAVTINTTRGSIIFYAGIAMVIGIGSSFSLGNLNGTLVCPNFEGLPMCYLSLVAGSTMLALDLVRRAIQARGPSKD